jgi:membrane protein implicated in regulation of membrane protease activity
MGAVFAIGEWIGLVCGMAVMGAAVSLIVRAIIGSWSVLILGYSLIGVVAVLSLVLLLRREKKGEPIA